MLFNVQLSNLTGLVIGAVISLGVLITGYQLNSVTNMCSVVFVCLRIRRYILRLIFRIFYEKHGIRYGQTDFGRIDEPSSITRTGGGGMGF